MWILASAGARELFADAPQAPAFRRNAERKNPFNDETLRLVTVGVRLTAHRRGDGVITFCVEALVRGPFR